MIEIPPFLTFISSYTTWLGDEVGDLGGVGERETGQNITCKKAK